MRERGCRWGGAIFSVGFFPLVFGREVLIWVRDSRWVGWLVVGGGFRRGWLVLLDSQGR